MRRLVRLAVRLVLLTATVATVYLGVTFAQVWQASRRDDAGPAQAIVVLGAAQYDGSPSPVLAARLDHAADLYAQGLAPVIVVTGGRRPGDRFTEAGASAQYLRERGVPDSSLRLETDGTSSWQSLAAAARFLREDGIVDVLLVSSPYHAMRVEQIADEVGLDGRFSPARTGPEGGDASVAQLGRETLAVAVGRLIGYRRLVRLDETVAEVRASVAVVGLPAGSW